MQNYTYFKTI